MLSSIDAIENSEYARFGKYLRKQHFIAVFLVALFLHIMGVAVYYVIPKEHVTEIPVRVLNVKLGNGDNSQSAITSADINRLFAKRRLAEPQKENAVAPVEQKLSKVIEKITEKVPDKPKKELARSALEKPKPKPEIVKNKTPKKPVKEKPQKQKIAKPKAENKTVQAKSKPKTKTKKVTKKPKENSNKELKRYVRSNQLTAKVGSKQSGSKIGNSKLSKAKIQKRYTQTVSLWLNKYKVYPKSARSAGIGGKLIVRIRINRQGRILRYMLEKSSGSNSIDSSIAQMIDAANPLPPVPFDYPDKNSYLEFLIPINFIP